MNPDQRDEIREDAREVALDILDWHATEAEWVDIAEVVEAAVEAAATGDDVALRAATVALELASPLRITLVGEEREERNPPPEQVRERVNRLVHELVDDPESTDPEASPR